MPPACRIEKRRSTRKASTRRGRGRPSDWSPSLQKRLIVLRLCGLQLAEIIKILNVLGDGTFKAKERRAQQILRETLCDGYSRYCGPNKEAARKRVAFLRGSKRCGRSSLIARQQVRTDSHREGTTVATAEHVASQDEESTKLSSAMPTIVPTHDAPDTLEAVLNSTWGLVLSHDGEAAMSLGDSSGSEPDRGAMESPRTSRAGLQTIREYDDLDTHMSDDSQSTMSNRKRQIRDILRTASYSSSMISDIQSMLNRFSLSTLATSSRASISIASIRNGDGLPLPTPSGNESVPAMVLERHRRRIQEANTSLIRKCCSYHDECIHRHIRAATISNLSNGSFRMDDVLAGTHVFGKGDDRGLSDLQNDHNIQQINSSDSYGNTTLFFAARSGATLDVILTLLARTFDVNAVNNDGQTFLFLLDPEEHSFSKCNCSTLLAGYHSSGFECLIRQLEERRFNFDQIDFNGRHFLSYLCALQSFKADWLVRLIDQDFTWMARVERLARVRDSSGTCLKDFIGLNHSNAEVITYDYLNCGFITDMSWHHILGSNSFISGSTPLTALIAAEMPFFDMKFTGEYLNRYGTNGLTAVMHYLEVALQGDVDELLVIKKLQELASLGAQLNARASYGSTMLHIAARRSCPEVIDHLLSVGIQIDHRNDAGFTALDYATQNFNQSRHAKAHPQTTANSLLSATRLLDYARLGFGRQKSLPRTAQKNVRKLEEEAQRSLESMTRLQRQDRVLPIVVLNSTDAPTTSIGIAF